MNASGPKYLIKIITCFLFILAAIPQSHAQILYKTFYNKNGKKVDSTKANFYILQQKSEDSLWIMQQYNIKGFMLRAGTYKDSTFKIPHGKVITFSKLLGVGFGKPKNHANDTLNYISDSRFYNNGISTGKWIIYYDDGNPQFINTHENGKLTGLHQTFNYGDRTLLESGMYLNGQRDGDWNIFDRRGNVVLKKTYKNGKALGTFNYSYHFKDAMPSMAFYEYMNKNVTNIVPRQVPKITFFCKITDSGQLVDPIIEGIGISQEIKKQLSDLVIACENWKPTFDTELNKNIEDKISFIVKITNGKAETFYSYFYDNQVHWIKH